MRTILTAGTVLLTNGPIYHGGIVVNNGSIEDVLYDVPAESELQIRSFGDAILSPGFIDVHVHGANGFDTTDGTYDALNGISRFLATTGTTSFLATTLTVSKDTLRKAVDAFVVAKKTGVQGASLIGMHLEGPFINPKKKGAQNEAHVRRPDVEELQQYIDVLGDGFKLITLAPELDEGFAVVRRARQAGAVVSAGHSCSSYETAIRAFDAGVSHSTHLFNGMEPLHHRDPGLVGAALADTRVHTEMIADKIHVHPGAMRVVLAAKGYDKVTLVTDCMRAGNLADGEYDLGGLKITVQEGVARTEEGSLAGSTLRMIDAVRNMVESCNAPLYQAVQMASLNPARELGMTHQTGSLEVGKDADLAVFDRAYNIITTYVKGTPVYESSIQVACP